jgi:hypothetical protein
MHTHDVGQIPARAQAPLCLGLFLREDPWYECCVVAAGIVSYYVRMCPCMYVYRILTQIYV